MEGSELRNLVKQLVQEVLKEMELTQGKAFNVRGTVSNLNADGTVDVATAAGVTLTGVGTPRTLVKGSIVTVITADGKKVAI